MPHAQHPRKYLADGQVNPQWKPRISGKSGRRHTHFKKAHFVAIDGEGIDTNAPPLSFLTNKGTKDETTYTANQHIYTLLAMSDSIVTKTLYSNNERLTTKECLDFLTESVKHYPKQAIFVSFAFSYDVTHILRDVSSYQIRRMLANDQQKYGRFGEYFIKYIPRKMLHIIKVRDANHPFKLNKNGSRSYDSSVSIRIWDTWGFFQGSFLNAITNWNVATEQEYINLKDGKEGRANFKEWDIEVIKDYNEIELITLNRMMGKVVTAAQSLNLVLNRYDGAGAIAAAIYKKELPKDYIRNIALPPEVDEAAHYAYFGGRIEEVQYGRHNTHDIKRAIDGRSTIFKYDINSAYPNAFRALPDMSQGRWYHRRDAPYRVIPFALYKTHWRYADTHPLYPFAYRDSTGRVSYPHEGYSWVWGIELENAHLIPNGEIEIDEAWFFEPYADNKPFSFIDAYYNQRAEIKQRIKQDAATDDDKGRLLTIKLGINSLYGKNAQKIGYNPETRQRPPFYNVAMAGYVTAYTRAMLYWAAMQKPESIIALATDGILCTEPLDVDIGTGLGQWECEEIDEVVQVQSGVYWLRKGMKWIEYSRGIDKVLTQEEITQRIRSVLTAWHNKRQTISYTLRRLIGLKYASQMKLETKELLNDNFWFHRGNWVTQTREIALYGGGHKRRDTDIIANLSPENGLVRTYAHSFYADWDNLSEKAKAPEDQALEEIDEFDDME